MAASAAHTVSLSSGWKLHDSSPELCHQERERKKKKTAFHSVAYYSEGDSLDDLVLSCKETLQSDRGAAVIIGSSVTKKWIFFRKCRSALSPCVGRKKQRSSRFSFFVLFLGLFLSPLAWTKLHDVVHRLISVLVPSSDFQPVTSYSSLWNFCLTWWALWATFLLQNNWAVVKKQTLSGSKLQNNYLFWSELNKRRYKPPCVAA